MKDEQLASKDKQIAMLEEKSIDMSLDLASANPLPLSQDIIMAKDEQLASKDEQIASLEKKIFDMSLDLASAKASEGALEDKLVHMSLEVASLKALEDYHEHKLATYERSCQQQQHATTVEEETTKCKVPQQQRKWTPALQQSRCRSSKQVSSLDDAIHKPTCMARLQDEVDAQQHRPKKFSRSLGDMLQSLNPQSSRRNTNDTEEGRTESSSLSSSLQTISYSDGQDVAAIGNGSVVILASKECRKLSMGISDVVDWD